MPIPAPASAAISATRTCCPAATRLPRPSSAILSASFSSPLDRNSSRHCAGGLASPVRLARDLPTPFALWLIGLGITLHWNDPCCPQQNPKIEFLLDTVVEEMLPRPDKRRLRGRSLAELRTALFEAELAEEGGVSPRVSPAADLGDIAGLLLRAGFARPVADTETLTVTYSDAVAMMHDLRGMGETNALCARRRTPLRRSTLARAAALYTERFGLPDGRIPATFEILFLTGRAP